MQRIRPFYSKMRQPLCQISSLATYGLILLLSWPPASSALIFTQSGEKKTILVTNKPFELQCTVEGTPSELANATITWKGPNSKGEDIFITGNDDYGKITVKRGTGKVTSILKVQKPPTDFLPKQPPAIESYKYYCKLDRWSYFLFRVYIVKGEAVPKIHPIQVDQTRHREKVPLKCDASYQITNFKIEDKFSVILSWIKDGKNISSKVVDYRHGNHTVTLSHTVTVNSREDAGIYVCQSQLALRLKDQTDAITDSKEIELRSWNMRGTGVRLTTPSTILVILFIHFAL